MYVVFTDLDGTLLDHETYSFDAARPAIERLRESQTPWVFVTSKTRAETEYWRGAMGNTHAFIIENGGAAYTPGTVIEFGTRYELLIPALHDAAREASCEVRGFADMSVDEVADVCGLGLQMAALAKEREYDEPFLLLKGDPAQLAQAISARGLNSTRGGRFWHILGRNDKGLAVRTLRAQFPKGHIAVALGDGLNDVEMLREVEIPVIMQSPHQQALQRLLPEARISPAKGPGGWNQMILSLISGRSEMAP